MNEHEFLNQCDVPKSQLEIRALRILFQELQSLPQTKWGDYAITKMGHYAEGTSIWCACYNVASNFLPSRSKA